MPSKPGRAPSASACEAFREEIEHALTLGRNAMAIWQDLVEERGFQAGYASVKRFVGKLRGSQPVEARVVITTARAKSRRWTTARGRWSAIPRRTSTEGRGCSR